MMFDAFMFARGWLSVDVASGDNPDRAAMHKTVCVEQYPGGMRLVATDSTLLLVSWIPDEDNDLDPEPSFDEPPLNVAIAADRDGRARSLLTFVLGQARKPNSEGMRLRVRLAGPVGEQHVLDGMERSFLIIDHPDAERVQLVCVEDEFPNWRKLLDGQTAKRTQQVSLAADMLTRLGKLGKLNRECPVTFGWGGATGPARLEVRGGDPFIYGLVMPTGIPGVKDGDL